ncbi:MAG TPA: M15 family metallopeptidase [Candidatus Obscuribacter sp.]|nr:D-alanyl-D-alanine carboxypeptidase family protein [Candidatus Obscuribacter sp.]HMW88567.1 M15 family metallopeptidase [Candidatus Obscuribacter sp.]HNB14403.1 M15 family metallopeptidase [Candidatus Obscuribacter sp.]HND04778.1 M15 family metallopeptidase [Candidatus Obscuribacter sp.]HND68730.1 M15 family metallopeptidase [Candidatus Obscuribacter sp.]
MKSILRRSLLAIVSVFAITGSAAAAEGNWKERALPKLQPSRAATALSYKDQPVDTAAAQNREPLVVLEDYGIACASFYARQDGFNLPYGRAFAGAEAKPRLRLGLARKLQQVNESLKGQGLEVLVLDGYRPVALQAQLFQFFKERAAREYPRAGDAMLKSLAGRYCSSAEQFQKNNPRTWPTHATGAAVDLTLRTIVTKEPLFMGGIFDDDSELSHTTYFEKPAKLSGLSRQTARENRRILYWAMFSAGFENYPYEWWHYDCGNQMWLMNRKNRLRQQGETASAEKAYYGLPDNI